MVSTILKNTLGGSILLILVGLCSCTKYNYIDGGVANGIHDCSMWEYFESQSYDWDSTRIMIEHAGMKSVFDGSGEQEQITFFGVTDITIARWMLQHNADLDTKKEQGVPVEDSEYWNRVTDIPASTCEALLKKLVVTERFMLKDVPKGRRQKLSDGSKYTETGGMVVKSLTGEIFVWMEPTDFAEIQDAGQKRLWMARRLNTASNWIIASTDIQTNNGVVHSMGYDFNLINF